MVLYRFHHDDGVVYHQTDGQDHGKHGQGIDGKAQQHEGAEGADQGNGDRQHRHHGGPEIAQENINDNQYQHQRFKEGMGNFFQRLFYELGLVLGDDQFHIRREPGFRIRQHLSYLRHSFDGIGIRSQGNRIHYRFAGYAFIQKQGRRRIHTFAFVYIRNVFQLQNLAVRNTDNDIPEFFRGFQTALGTGRIFEFLVAGSGFGTDRTYRSLDILRLNGSCHFCSGQSQLGHQVRL